MKNVTRYMSLSAMVLVVSACSNVGQIDQMKGELLIHKADFLYKTAFVSENQPELASIFMSKKNSQHYIKSLLVEKGFEVAVDAISLESYRANVKNESLLIECSYSAANNMYQRNGKFGQSLSCGAYDLFDGKKVYEGEADMKANLATDYDYMALEGIRISLMKLPNVNGQAGKVISQAEIFSKISKR